MLAPYDLVISKFEVPPGIERRDWQVAAINETAVLKRTGLYAEVGTGKTFLSTFNALIQTDLRRAHHHRRQMDRDCQRRLLHNTSQQ